MYLMKWLSCTVAISATSVLPHYFSSMKFVGIAYRVSQPAIRLILKLPFKYVHRRKHTRVVTRHKR